MLVIVSGIKLDTNVFKQENMCSQVIVSVGSGPWDQLFGGGNSPALAVGAAAGFIGGIVAILAIPRTRIQKPIPLP